MKTMLCSRCKKNPAVVFVQKMENNKPVQEGLCLKCALELNIPPVRQMMDQMGLTEQDIDDAMEQMNEMMNSMGDDFEPGGASLMPFLNGIMGGNLPQRPTDGAESDEKETA